MKCYNCGCESPEGSAFCANCGANLGPIAHVPIPSPVPMPPIKEKKKSKAPIIILIISVCLLAVAAILTVKFDVFDSIFNKDAAAETENSPEGGEDDGHNLPDDSDYGEKPDEDKDEGKDNGEEENEKEPSNENESLFGGLLDHETETASPETIPPETEAPETEPVETEPVWEGSERVVIANGGLNLRSGPGTSSPVIDCIPNGNIITVEKAENNWAYVYYNGHYGWCICDYLYVPINYDLSPICSATVKCDSKITVICDDYDNGNTVRLDLANGETVYVYEINGEECFIKYKNIYCYCYGYYLTMH